MTSHNDGFGYREDPNLCDVISEYSTSRSFHKNGFKRFFIFTWGYIPVKFKTSNTQTIIVLQLELLLSHFKFQIY